MLRLFPPKRLSAVELWYPDPHHLLQLPQYQIVQEIDTRWSLHRSECFFEQEPASCTVWNAYKGRSEPSANMPMRFSYFNKNTQAEVQDHHA